MHRYYVSQEMHEDALEYANDAADSLFQTRGYFDVSGDAETDRAERLDAMYWGKIGEFAVAEWLEEQGVPFQGDPAPMTSQITLILQQMDCC